mmetsp:Transcript_5673/g.18245  ORF Transcript_5673/g.18245 Transcript_5673/m.18245 type:complete len:259 (-) Transcript_5673:2091-2867(-)
MRRGIGESCGCRRCMQGSGERQRVDFDGPPRRRRHGYKQHSFHEPTAGRGVLTLELSDLYDGPRRLFRVPSLSIDFWPQPRRCVRPHAHRHPPAPRRPPRSDPDPLSRQRLRIRPSAWGLHPAPRRRPSRACSRKRHTPRCRLPAVPRECRRVLPGHSNRAARGGCSAVDGGVVHAERWGGVRLEACRRVGVARCGRLGGVHVEGGLRCATGPRKGGVDRPAGHVARFGGHHGFYVGDGLLYGGSSVRQTADAATCRH